MKKDNQFEYRTRHGDIGRVEVTLDIYAYYNNLYLGMDYYDAELGGMDRYSDITVNITETPYLYSVIDTNNNGEEIVAFLEENGFGMDTGKVVSSGWCARIRFSSSMRKPCSASPRMSSGNTRKRTASSRGKRSPLAILRK